LYVRTATVPETPWERCQYQHQRAQEEFAYRWGWASDKVTVLEEDIGRSGLATDRPGYQTLHRLVATGSVGLVLVSDLARLSRSSTMLLEFLAVCQRTNTFVAAGGHLIDLTQPPENYPERLYRLVSGFYQDLTSLFKELDTRLDELD
jgi:DNA invertase Pin-like site-specific DNA recombinase